jgi:hypothetical protein
MSHKYLPVECVFQNFWNFLNKISISLKSIFIWI